VACKMYHVASSFGFSVVSVGMTPVLKIRMPLPLFPVQTASMENGPRVLEELEMEAGRILGSFGPKEYDALEMAKLPNGGRLNHVFEQMGLAYAPCPLPGTEAFQATREKRKSEVSKKPIAKKVKTAPIWAISSKMMPLKRIGIVKMVRPKAKIGLQGMSEIELALAKTDGVSKQFCLLDAPSSSHSLRDGGPAVTKVSERTAHVVAFDNLGDDSSSDVRETPLPQESKELPSPPPLMPR
jgi:hypothetical protein